MTKSQIRELHKINTRIGSVKGWDYETLGVFEAGLWEVYLLNKYDIDKGTLDLYEKAKENIESLMDILC